MMGTPTRTQSWCREGCIAPERQALSRQLNNKGLHQGYLNFKEKDL